MPVAGITAVNRAANQGSRESFLDTPLFKNYSSSTLNSSKTDNNIQPPALYAFSFSRLGEVKG